MDKEPLLGIIGGMGPLATAYFYELIINKTNANCDQDHINMVILNDASIADRTSFILGESNVNPLPRLMKDAHTLESLGASLIAIPCNTSTYFYEDLVNSVKIPILNMIEDTVRFLKSSGVQKVLILATKGTLLSCLYQSFCKKHGIKYILPSNIDEIMNIIYGRVKKGIPLDSKDIEILHKDETLADAVILGCTELSILKGTLSLGENYIDPLEIETDIILDFFHKEKREKPISLTLK